LIYEVKIHNISSKEYNAPLGVVIISGEYTACSQALCLFQRGLIYCYELGGGIMTKHNVLEREESLLHCKFPSHTTTPVLWAIEN
jgi:hypothetical protein